MSVYKQLNYMVSKRRGQLSNLKTKWREQVLGIWLYCHVGKELVKRIVFKRVHSVL